MAGKVVGETLQSYHPHSINALCINGKRQSPIDLDIGKAIVMRWPPLHFHHYDAPGYITSHKYGQPELAQNFRNGERPYITGGGLMGKYYLQQFHFHWGEDDSSGSEHTVARLHYPVEIHFVHILEGYNATTALENPETIAVVAVFLQPATKGQPLTDLEKAFDSTNIRSTQSGSVEYIPQGFLPRDTSTFFRYEGSLTTPPCTEGVIWTILAEPSYISEQQLDFLRSHISAERQELLHSWREVQPLHNRPIYLNKLKVLIKSMNFEEIAPLVAFLIITLITTAIFVQYAYEMEIFT
ncbi:unnamed protein product [Cylicocyclus nassatus]|uniref:Carbonic anhydrase n=1 Tax=Cylicocyclus nassatus TaxID=53992 RepID=A0AA36GIT1_CYLNA|nr:unnamed protein product [Cylicocyclus nassatus]